ncbi:MAG: hypothetical protein QF721_09950 [Verrucomicrobiota bacterium]|nr:hypothetical protein [Verrucomicrobiota bacterium]MDP7049764.1 hypothetical protein [Verrucomicrobiota bacterium]
MSFSVTSAEPHSFHIPVMGTGFSIDTCLKVARFGIHSVLSLCDDEMIERVREYHCKEYGVQYEEIAGGSGDHRARRITAYLNQLNLIVKDQFEILRQQPFETEEDITRYFTLLPEGQLKCAYDAMKAETDMEHKKRQQDELRLLIKPGRIDVNLMTKVDCTLDRVDNRILDPDKTDALTGLKGFAESDLQSSVIFSAGMNPRLYGAIAKYPDFFPDSSGEIKKQIVLKVSDYRSAAIQGRFLAKKGIWVSEWRFESGLNCGGHAFATQGMLMGPILKEFKERRLELIETLFPLYEAALAKTNREIGEPPSHRFTVQGGVGTHAEHDAILKYYEADATGWGSPFLLVPEVVRIDNEHLEKVCAAGEKEIKLTRSSPLGIPFWNLLTSESEDYRRKRIADGKAGSICPHRYLKFNTEFAKKPICRSSTAYQTLKIKEINERDDLSEEQKAAHVQETTDRACICFDLSAPALKVMNLPTNSKLNVCVGPNARFFDKVSSFSEMVDHIYGRIDLLRGKNRPNMFVNELKLYMEYMAEEVERVRLKLSNQTREYFEGYKLNLLDGIEYYRGQADNLVAKGRENFLSQLDTLAAEIDAMVLPAPLVLESA